MKKIGDIVKENRKRIGITQAQLANYANVSKKFIGELENNKETIELNKLYDVLNVLDLTILIVSKKEIEQRWELDMFIMMIIYVGL